jgi:hypothetical protein
MKIREGAYYRTRGGDGGAEEMTAHEVTYDALQKRIAELQAENARLREALTNAAAVIGSFYAFAETADAVSISGIARCHAMLTSMKKNRRRIEETVMTPARAALGEKE